MNVAGKYLFVKLTEIDLWRVIGTEPPGRSQSLWTIAGRGVGENARGLWLTPETFFEPGVKEGCAISKNGPTPATVFIAWDVIHTVLAYDEKPCDSTPKIGIERR